MADIHWQRVTKKEPCTMCGKGDWCTRSELGACCMRVESSRQLHNGGWLHTESPRLAYTPRVQPRSVVSAVDFLSLWESWRKTTPAKQIIALAESLGVEPEALDHLGCCWAQGFGAFGFPMWNGKLCGIRLRNDAGDKWAVRGSRQGLFEPWKMEPQKTLFCCEGPTDTAALLSMGFYTVGRPSCIGCEQHVNDLIRKRRVRRVVVVADNDEPGIRGAEKLQATLKVPSVIYIPPAKDVREAMKNGLDALEIKNTVGQTVWTNP